MRYAESKKYWCSKCSDWEVWKFKWNLFYVTSGKLKIKVHKNDYDLIDETILGHGEWTTVKPGEYHSFEAEDDTLAFELYYPEHNEWLGDEQSNWD